MVKLRSAADLLRKYPVVGLRVIKYPDASAVGHARRLTGHRQEPFISGGSLLVNPQRLDGFFPPVYHEDWLCIINHLRRGEVAVGGTVGQLAYKPFTTSDRARLEEFGDILAFGLLWLVHARHGRNEAESALAIAECDYWREATERHFWEEILGQRATLLGNIASRLESMSPHGPAPLQSLKAAQQRCAQLTPAEFVSFTENWLDSLAVWRSLLSDLGHADSVGKALAELGLSHAVRMYEADPADASATPKPWNQWGRGGATAVDQSSCPEFGNDSRCPGWNSATHFQPRQEATGSLHGHCGRQRVMAAALGSVLSNVRRCGRPRRASTGRW